MSEIRLCKKEHQILSYIYQLRTLSFHQIFHYLFLPDGCSESYCSKLLKTLVSTGLITKQGFYKTDCYYFITTKGISCLKNYGILSFGKKDNIPYYPDRYLIASKIKMEEKIISHQLSLNNFALSFRHNYPSDFTYYDEKFVSQIFSDIRPDGIIKLGNDYFFLEMDMCSERKALLIEKWKNYRSFLTSQDTYKVNGSIKVLFILGGRNQLFSTRTKNLQSYIIENLWDILCPDSDFYIGSFETLYPLMIKKTFDPRSFFSYGFTVNRGTFNEELLSRYHFDYYISKLDDNGQIMVENKMPLEFVVDDYSCKSSYVLYKMQAFPSFQSTFQFLTGRTIRYLILVRDEQDAVELLSHLDFDATKYLFTTGKRLTKDSFYDACFCVKNDGSIFHFSENDLRVPVFEAKLSCF